VAKTDNSSLDDLLAIKYQKTIETWWPFKAVTSSGAVPTSTGVITDASNTDGGSLPTYVPPLLGTILGLLVIITILCTILFWVRRKKQRRRLLASDSGASTVVKKRQSTWSWLMGVNAEDKDDRDYYGPESDAKHGHLDGSTIVGTPGCEKSNPVEAPEDAVIYEMGGKSKDFVRLKDSQTDSPLLRYESHGRTRQHPKACEDPGGCGRDPRRRQRNPRGHQGTPPGPATSAADDPTLSPIKSITRWHSGVRSFTNHRQGGVISKPHS
jgi:hypothetical protein